jgi:hypothetical protein
MDSNALPEKKKRGRKSKKELEMMKNLELEKQEEDNEIKLPKKRGRKPRGGKIFPKINTINSVINEKNNIILHLKCSLSDIDNKNYDENIEHFQFNETKIHIQLIMIQIIIMIYIMIKILPITVKVYMKK